MNKQKNKISLRGISSILCLVAFLISYAELTAQSSKDFSYQKKYEDYTIPSTASGYIVLTTQGGDGGKILFKNRLKEFTVGGGGGAYLKACFKIGNGANALKPGATLRFIVGGKGESRNTAGSTGAGGGAGSAIAYKKLNTTSWDLLMVAGGGGASGHSWASGEKPGKSAKGYAERLIDEKGEGGESDPTVGGGGGAYVDDHEVVSADGESVDLYGGHAKAGWSNGPEAGEPTGGACKGLGPQGGWGFGAGGDGDATGCYTGGGGGFIGGDAGVKTNEAAAGGISYLNEDYAKSFLTHDGSRTNSPSDGYAKVAYSDNLVTYQRQVQLSSAATPKCLTNQGGKLDNGNNIYSINCDGEKSSQQWVWGDNHFKLAADQSKCLDVKDHGTANNTNIRTWDCMDHNEQRWIYDGLTKQFRSFLNLDKCMDASLTGGSNVKLWDCSTTTHQKWDITGGTTISEPTDLAFVPRSAQNLAIHSHTNTEVGSNIQLWTYSTTNTAMKWQFDGLKLKLNNRSDRCVDLKNGSTSNGTNVHLWECKDKSSQEWLFDGLSNTIRSGANPKKCLQVNGSYEKRANIELWDCNGSERQQFDIISK